MNVEYNISRLYYLLDMYKLSMDDLLASLNVGRKQPIVREEIETGEIKLSYLKKIDTLFNKGINFYLDPKTLDKSKESSIFFRKEKFNSELNLGARKIVNHFEEFKINFSAIASLSDVNLARKLPVYSINQDPLVVASQVRSSLYPEFALGKRDFLKALITKLAESNILVSEFVETWNKKEKANIDGVFLAPNVIVLKRQQNALRREVFTLAHEIGHYLLNVEEIESLNYEDLISNKETRIERWCNDFAFYFLAGEYASVIENIKFAGSENDYHLNLVTEISNHTHLSRLAVYTRLLITNKLSHQSYLDIKRDLDEQYIKKEEEQKRKRELEKLQGIPQGGAVPKPIQSPLLIWTLQTAFYEGVVNEFDVCKTLHIAPDKFNLFLEQ